MTRTVTGKVIGVSVFAALAFGAVAAAFAYEPPNKADCAVLLQQAERSSDTATLIAEAGCLSPDGQPVGRDATNLP